jgi:hypothetical protein
LENNNDGSIKISLHHWGIKDLLGFEIQFPNGIKGLDGIELQYVTDGEKMPYLKVSNKWHYEKTIERIENAFIGKDKDVKKTIVNYIKDFEKDTDGKFKVSMKKFVDGISPFQIKREIRGTEEIIEFSCRRKGEEFELKYIYNPEKKEIKETTIKYYLRRVNFVLTMDNIKIDKNDSDFLEYYLKQELGKRVDGWLEKELEIKMGSLYN